MLMLRQSNILVLIYRFIYSRYTFLITMNDSETIHFVMRGDLYLMTIGNHISGYRESGDLPVHERTKWVRLSAHCLLLWLVLFFLTNLHILRRLLVTVYLSSMTHSVRTRRPSVSVCKSQPVSFIYKHMQRYIHVCTSCMTYTYVSLHLCAYVRACVVVVCVCMRV